MKAKLFDGKGEKEAEIPAGISGEAESMREALIEAAAESDESLMEKYFEGEELSQDEIVAGLCVGVREGIVTPVCCSAAQAQYRRTHANG